MSGVFQNIDPPPQHRPASVYPPAFGSGGGHTRWVERGWGVNILEDARRYVLYICKYFVVGGVDLQMKSADSLGVGIRVVHAIRIQHCVQGFSLRAVLRIRIRSQILFLGLPNPYLLVRRRTQDPSKAKIVRNF
jgi:hypothetical protein